MGNLDAVQPEPALEELIGDIKGLELGPPDIEVKESSISGVYGSRFASIGLPKYRLFENEMPKEIAYRMIKDEMALDGTPQLNLASFVTTYMEDEATKLMVDAFPVNSIDLEEYPKTGDLQNRCVSIISRLFNIPETGDGSIPMGGSSVGSSEAIMLATLAMKKSWVAKRKAAGKDFSNPNIVMSSAVQVCWEKAARYFDVEEKYVYCTDERYVIDPKLAIEACDENTIGICAILGVTYTGHYEDVKAINDLLVEKNMDVPIHVDAASGGFVAPFVNPKLEWDFRLPKVVSINVSGHKYGLVYPGVGWVIWRDPKYLPKELIFNIDYLGAPQANMSLNFSRGASQIIGQYYQLVRLGRTGYTNIMVNLTRVSDYLAHCVQKMGFILMSETRGKGLPLVAWRINPKDNYHFDEFAIAHQLREHGWIVPAYKMAPHAKDMKMMRVVVREDFSKAKCDDLIADLKSAVDTLKSMDKAQIEVHLEQVKKKASGRSKAQKPNSHFKDEKHSLQGKHGKTHAVC